MVKCKNCDTEEFIEILCLYYRGPYTLYVITCKMCDAFTTCKTDARDYKQENKDCIKAWDEFNHQ